MRTWVLGATFLCACNSTGSGLQPGSDSGADATAGDAAADAFDAAEELEGEPPCLGIITIFGLPLGALPSTDCIYAGACPEDCAMGTQAAYACNPASVSYPSVSSPEAGAYPSAFEAPGGLVNIIDYASVEYPWDAGAFVSCAPLTCVRWSTADHVDGGSAWPTNPCGTQDAAPLAWVCPPFAGVLPATDAGCTNAGDMNDIGGQGTGVPSQAVWCCGGPLPATDAGSSGDASPVDAAVDAGLD